MNENTRTSYYRVLADNPMLASKESVVVGNSTIMAGYSYKCSCVKVEPDYRTFWEWLTGKPLAWKVEATWTFDRENNRERPKQLTDEGETRDRGEDQTGEI